jgi:hypothetical protein
MCCKYNSRSQQNQFAEDYFFDQNKILNLAKKMKSLKVQNCKTNKKYCKKYLFFPKLKS